MTRTNSLMQGVPASSTHANYTVIYPEDSDIKANIDTRFIYIMRKDGVAVSSLMAEKISEIYGLPTQQVAYTIEQAYNKFVDGLIHVMGSHFQDKGKTEIHVFEADEIDVVRTSYLGENAAISLDPLFEGKKVFNVGISRGYLPGGKIEIGMVPRPGCAPLPEQVKSIKSAFNASSKADIFEDDIYTGGSLLRVLDMLKAEGVDAQRIVVGIQVGAAAPISARGIDIKAVVKYHIADGQEIDLGDPRDFLIGADGLVVLLDKNNYGRMPYIIPFVSPHSRLSIPTDQEDAFSKEVLKLNVDFYKDIESDLGISVLLSHLNKPSADALVHMLSCPKDAKIAEILNQIDVHFEELKQKCEVAKVRSAISLLDFPKRIIFLDVNGTIIPSDAENIQVDPSKAKVFHDLVGKLKGLGSVVGLNSDSPLPQLQVLAQQLGIEDCPIIAENGGVISYRGKEICVRTLDDLPALKARIQDLAEQFPISHKDDIIAPEFGGQPLQEGDWSFGANRKASLSLFSDNPNFLSAVKGLIEDAYRGTNVDCDFSPQYNFLSVHGCKDFRKGKSDCLMQFVNRGHQIISIGDSLSDYAPFNLPNRVVFVQDGIPEDILAQHHVTKCHETVFMGVIEALNGIVLESQNQSLKAEVTYGL